MPAVAGETAHCNTINPGEEGLYFIFYSTPIESTPIHFSYYNSTPIAPCTQQRPGHHAPQPINTPSRRPHMRQGTRTRGTRPLPGTGRNGTTGAAARGSSAPHARIWPLSCVSWASAGGVTSRFTSYGPLQLVHWGHLIATHTLIRVLCVVLACARGSWWRWRPCLT